MVAPDDRPLTSCPASRVRFLGKQLVKLLRTVPKEARSSHPIEGVRQEEHALRMAPEQVRGLVADIGDDGEPGLLDLGPDRSLEIGRGAETGAVRHGVKLLVPAEPSLCEVALGGGALVLWPAGDEEDGDVQW